MPRVTIVLPEQFHFSVQIPVRISDINYGGHLGNDTVLSIVHEARVQFLKKAGYTELNIEGIGLIITDAVIEYKSEVFYGETIKASVKATEFTKTGFDIFYKLEKDSENGIVLVSKVKTGMLGYDYTKKKIAAIPETAIKKLSVL
jgi:acyl-CoA thioesterase FadM